MTISKLSSVPWLVLLLILSGVFTACGGGGSEVSLGLAGRASIAEISSATAEIQKTVPGAIIVWAGGRKRGGGTVPDPQKCDTWDFIAMDLNDPAQPSWDMVLYQNVWEITPRTVPPMGIAFVDLTTVWMDVSAARKLTSQAGITLELRTWELYQEINPSYPNPLFMFVLADGQKAFVDSITGDVFINSLTQPVMGADNSGSVLKTLVLANEQAKKINTNAIVIRASGMDIQGGVLTSPEDTTSWDFTVYLQVNGNSKYWQLHYSFGDWWNQEIETPPVEALPTDITALDVSGESAWSQAVASGKINAAISWEVYRPTSTAAYPNIIYAFLNDTTAEYVIVDTDTGEVSDSVFLP